MAEIRFEFEAVGGAEVAETFEDIRVKEIGASENARILGEELRKIRASGQVSAQGIQVLTREMVRAQVEADKLAAKARQVQSATRQMSGGLRNLQGGSNELVNMLTEMSLGLGGISPQMRELSVHLASAGNNVVQLGRVLPGPYGILVGMGMSLLPLLITKIVEWSRATDDAAKKNNELARSARTAANETRNLIEQMRRRDALARMSTIGEPGSTATAEDIEEVRLQTRAQREQVEVRLREARARLEEANARRTGAATTRAAEEARNEMARLERSVRDHERAVRNLRAEEERLNEARARRLELDLGQAARDAADEWAAEELASAGTSRRRGGRSRVDREARELERRLANEERFFQELQRLRDRDLDHEIRTREQVNAAIRREDEIMRREEEREQRRMRAAAEKAKREADRQLELARKEAERAIEETRQNAEHLLTPAIHNITGAVAEIVAGTKSADEAFQGLLSGFLEMLSQQAALEAAKEYAAAVGSFASYDYSGGALHLAAGAAWTGVAIAAGGAAIATAPSVAQPASPQQEERPSQPSGGQVVVNLNGAVVTAATHAELGRELSREIAYSNRRFGAAA